MKIATGSDQALIFFNHIISRLLKPSLIIRKTFKDGITPEEKLHIINALEDYKYIFNESTPWREPIKMVRKVDYDGITNIITVSANPRFTARLNQTSLQNWPFKIKRPA